MNFLKESNDNLFPFQYSSKARNTRHNKIDLQSIARD
jgi:hypothetical protein